MRHTIALLALAALGCTPSAPGATGPNPEPVELTLTPVADGLDRPVHLAAPAEDDRLFVAEKTGRVRIVRDGVLLPTAFLDLSALVSSGSEQGLLGIAFHPDYSSNGRFFVNYTDRAGGTRIVRYVVSSNPDAADPASATLLLYIDQPATNHNGGHLVFGPDGMLYVAVGDGGGGGDPQGNGQNPGTLLGTILRINVDAGVPYGIPPDNPFVGHPTFRPEIWLWGLRNPWRIDFDEATGDLYVADVGQNEWEEVTVVGPAGGGSNLGWSVMEGLHCFRDPCTPEDFTLPQLEYSHGEGCSITGGHVYRGSITELRGTYFYSDFCQGWLRSFRLAGGVATETTEWAVPNVGNVTSFGEGADGALYLLTNASVLRIDERADP